jgi:cytochrome b561
MSGSQDDVRRYHGPLIVLHWLLALGLVATLAYGFLVVAPTTNTDVRKIDMLRLHMAGGMLLFALMLLRLIVRLVTRHPSPVTSGHAGLDRLARLVHWAFYGLVLLMATTGLATAVLAKLNEIVFAGSGAPLPADLGLYPTRVAHGYLAWVFVILIALHVVAALDHHLVRGDGLLGRMGFGPRARLREGTSLDRN